MNQIEKIAAPFESRPSSRVSRTTLPIGQFLRRLGIGEEGVNLVETAMVYAIFLPMLFGAIEFSLALYAYQDIADAARQASRWAAVRGALSCTNVPSLSGCGAKSTDVTAFVRAIGYPGIVPANMGVTTTWLTESATPASWSTCSKGVCNAPGNEVSVTVTYAYPIAIAYWKATNINISSTGTMVIEQ